MTQKKNAKLFWSAKSDPGLPEVIVDSIVQVLVTGLVIFLGFHGQLV